MSLEPYLPFLLGAEWLTVLGSLGYLAGRISRLSRLGGSPMEIGHGDQTPARSVLSRNMRHGLTALIALLLGLAGLLPITLWLAVVLPGLGTARASVDWAPFYDMLLGVEVLAVAALALGARLLPKLRSSQSTRSPKGLV